MNSFKKSMKESAILLSVLLLLKDKNLSFSKIWGFLYSVEQKVPLTISEQFRRWNETQLTGILCPQFDFFHFLRSYNSSKYWLHMFSYKIKENVGFTIHSQSTSYLTKGRFWRKKKKNSAKEKHQVSNQSLIVY